MAPATSSPITPLEPCHKYHDINRDRLDGDRQPVGWL